MYCTTPTSRPRSRMECPRVYCNHCMLITAMNPCPCGYYGDQVRRGPPRSAECTCSNSMVSRYQKRISGSLLDRSAKPPSGLDTLRRIEVPRVEYDKLSDERSSRVDSRWSQGEPSAAIQARVEAARERQRSRFEGTGLMSNADTPALAPKRQRRCKCGPGRGAHLLPGR